MGFRHPNLVPFSYLYLGVIESLLCEPVVHLMDFRFANVGLTKSVYLRDRRALTTLNVSENDLFTHNIDTEE